MDKKEILSAVADAHNTIVEIKVCGDDVLTMARAINTLRQLANKLQQDIATESAKSAE